jgi:ankyrin repeat protein
MNALSRLKFRRNGFHLACSHGALNVVIFLVEKGFDINKASFGRTTAFHYACLGGHLPVVKYLIEKGCDMYAHTDLIGHRGLPIACKKNRLLVIQFLLNFDWNLHLTSGLHILLKNFSNSLTLDHISTELNIVPCILLLLEAGAELPQNHSLPSKIKLAVKHRLVEITFTKTKLFKKFPARIAQLITDLTMLPSTDKSLQNLPQYL